MARQSRPTLLLTRPETASLRFAEQVRAVLGDMPVLIAPILAPEFRAADLPERFDGLIFSSETGVEGFCRLHSCRALTAWCVGPRTADCARRAGFAVIEAGGDARALASRIMADMPRGLLLHARGADTTGTLAEDLRRAGLLVAGAVVYAQIAQPLSSAARHLMMGAAPILLPVFSPRTAQVLLAELDGQRSAPLWLASLSPAVARVASALRPERESVADTPDAAGMIAALARLLGASGQA